MIDRKDVPNEVAKAALEYFDGYDMKEAIAAALNAWPGAEVGNGTVFISGRAVKELGHILLPLPAAPRGDND